MGILSSSRRVLDLQIPSGKDAVPSANREIRSKLTEYSVVLWLGLPFNLLRVPPDVAFCQIRWVFN